MMDVKETLNDGLKRAFTISVPAAEVEKAVVERLATLSRTIKMQGFRPGKVPMDLVRKRYGQEARVEVLDAMVKDCVETVLSERKIRPAMRPDVKVLEIAEGADLAFSVDVESMPDIAVTDFSALSFERVTADVPEAEVDEAMGRLARSVRETAPVSDNRAARKGDVVIIDYAGTVGGVALPGMKAEDQSLELGSQTFVGKFEEQLEGRKAGDTVQAMPVEFPENYPTKQLAGQTALFDVTVKEVREYVEAQMDDAMAKKFGMESLAELRKQVAEEIGSHYGQVGRTALKRQVMDRLADAHDFPLPSSVVEAEFNPIWKNVQDDRAHDRLDEDDKAKSEDVLREEYHAIAERRVKLGLVFSAVAEKNKIEVSRAELQQAIVREAQRRPGQEQAVVNFYVQNPEAVERLRAPILEDKIVDFILAQAKVSDKKVEASELMALLDVPA